MKYLNLCIVVWMKLLLWRFNYIQKYASNVHNCSTRQAKAIRIPRHRLRSTSSSVLAKGPEIYNTILDSIKALPCIKPFSQLVWYIRHIELSCTLVFTNSEICTFNMLMVLTGIYGLYAAIEESNSGWQ